MVCWTRADGHVKLMLQLHHVDKSFVVPTARVLVAVYQALTKERIAGVT